MFINEIIWLKMEKVSGNRYTSKKCADQSDFILHYASSTQNLNPIYIPYPDSRFDEEDEHGRYYKSSGTFQKQAFQKKGKDYWKPHQYNENPFYLKYYQHESKGQRIGNTWIDISQYTSGKLKYPTEKPYKLLERIICLSTK